MKFSNKNNQQKIVTKGINYHKNTNKSKTVHTKDRKTLSKRQFTIKIRLNKILLMTKFKIHKILTRVKDLLLSIQIRCIYNNTSMDILKADKLRHRLKNL